VQKVDLEEDQANGCLYLHHTSTLWN